jgi:hypothetical protein
MMGLTLMTTGWKLVSSIVGWKPDRGLSPWKITSSDRIPRPPTTRGPRPHVDRRRWHPPAGDTIGLLEPLHSVEQTTPPRHNAIETRLESLEAKLDAARGQTTLPRTD